MNRISSIMSRCWYVVIMRLTWVLSDFLISMKLRGYLLKFCFKRCGRNFQIASSAELSGILSALEIGDDVYVSPQCWLVPIGGIIIESEVMLGPQTVIVTGNHTLKDGSYRFGIPHRRPVKIGKGSWTGAGVKIMPGVTIGKGVLCAAGSVVTRDVPDYSIVAGVPAKIVAVVDPVDGHKKMIDKIDK